MSLATRYEVTAIHEDGTTMLVCYTPRNSMAGLAAAIRGRALPLGAALRLKPDAAFYPNMKPRIHFTAGAWKIGFTGRTQRQAMQEGAHRYYEAVLAEAA
jgi:hypothetical protein